MACLRPFMLKGGSSPLPVPCGKCPACRLSRAQGWIFRLQQESKRSFSAYFVTLTYDSLDRDNLTSNKLPTLFKRHLQLYFKTLRNDHFAKYGFVPVIRYYAVGEYGAKSKRPHYHVILFNSDKELISDAWRDSFGAVRGFVHIGDATGSSIAYTTKYVCKPPTVPAFKRDDRLPEFSLMSKRLGDNYLTSAILRYHRDDATRNFVVEPGGVKVAMPRYYREKLFHDGHKSVQRAVIQRLKVDRHRADTRHYFSLYPKHSFLQYASVVEARLEHACVRNFINSQSNRNFL